MCGIFRRYLILEESCFQFLKYKFLTPSLQTSRNAQKKCFSSPCQKPDFKFSLLDQKDLEIDEVEEFLDSKMSKLLTVNCRYQAVQSDSSSADSASQTCESMLRKRIAPWLCRLMPQIPKIPESVWNRPESWTVESSVKDIQGCSFSHMSRRGECLGGIQDCAVTCRWF